jgi:DNA polymerase-3 subunit delta
LTFPQFKSGPFKAVQADDGATAALVDAWDSILNPPVEGKKKKKSCFQRSGSGQKSQKPFPVFQTLKKADNFSRETLISAMIDLSEIDLRMKSTGQDPRHAAGNLFDQAVPTSRGQVDRLKVVWSI